MTFEHHDSLYLLFVRRPIAHRMSVSLRHFVSLQRVYVGPTLLLGLIDLQESIRQRDTRIYKEEPTWELGRREEGRKGRHSYRSWA